MQDPTIRAAGEPLAVGATTVQGDPLTVAIATTVPGGRRHVALRWPYAAPSGPEETPAEQLDGVDLTSREALSLGVLLVRAHTRIERGQDAISDTVPGRVEWMVGRVRPRGRGTGYVLGVRIRRNPSGSTAIGVHWDRGLELDGPSLMWFSLRDARVFAGAMDVLGADDVAALVLRAVALATALRADQEGDAR